VYYALSQLWNRRINESVVQEPRGNSGLLLFGRLQREEARPRYRTPSVRKHRVLRHHVI